jgi:hypothetical protein
MQTSSLLVIDIVQHVEIKKGGHIFDQVATKNSKFSGLDNLFLDRRSTSCRSVVH